MKPWLCPMRRKRNHQTPKKRTIGTIQDNTSRNNVLSMTPVTFT